MSYPSHHQIPPEDWLTKKRDSVMVVAVLIATMAFQAAVSPTGGVWQDNSSGHRAGEAVMAYKNPNIQELHMLQHGGVCDVTQHNLAAHHRLAVQVQILHVGPRGDHVGIRDGGWSDIWGFDNGGHPQNSQEVAQIVAWEWLMAVLLVGTSLRLLRRWWRSPVNCFKQCVVTV
ncbi:hypothetical protein SASPL_102310 [Salvia splendens]|uniref:PGG domain-containing protein n=1 Tax=Salvia splendens TaxID=180675 RepID=A0A8X8YTG3_SALSN|nr:hypothetical protein SASPL_102310 [Salvia splendens]